LSVVVVLVVVVVVVMMGGGLLFFRIHVKGIIQFFCDAGGGQDILFSC
jgi:hypothetical protein